MCDDGMDGGYHERQRSIGSVIGRQLGHLNGGMVIKNTNEYKPLDQANLPILLVRLDCSGNEKRLVDWPRDVGENFVLGRTNVKLDHLSQNIQVI